MTQQYRSHADRFQSAAATLPASGTKDQAFIDVTKSENLERALGQLFQAWKGAPEEQSAVRFSLVVGSDSRQAIAISPTNEHAIVSATQAQQFLSVVAGAVGDFRAKFDDSGSLKITEPLQKWALGIQKMRSGLAQDNDIAAAR